ncbi:MAG: Arc family DNA-binding protein [Oscillospiraceae bacterium]|nr:Arc family DNA-binding protein [Oscillospiraceae bacterium]
MSPVTEKHKKYTAEYVKAHYDEFRVRMKKGKREQVQAHAAAHGESMNAFINRAIDEAMQRDKEEG